MQKKLALTGLFIGIVASIALSRLPPVADKYCDMVQIHTDTQGQYGWKPYKHNEHCNKR